MTSPKLLSIAMTLLLLTVVPYGAAATGESLPLSSLSMSGPLLSRVVFSICANDTTCSGLLSNGNIQAAEWSFAVGGWTSLCPPPEGKSGPSEILCGSTPGYSWYGLAFDTLKFPGDNVNFRRAMQFLQDYSYIQGTVLGGVEGRATNTPVPCFAYLAACNQAPVNTHYGTAQNLMSAGVELEKTSDGATTQTLFCDNGGAPCSGTYGIGSEWCTVTYCSQGGTPFVPALYYGAAHHQNAWAAAMVTWAGDIGLTINAHPITNSSVALGCAYPSALEIKRAGAYDPSTGYNADPVQNGPGVAADRCDMYTYGLVSSAPALNFLLGAFDSQFAGTFANPSNVYDDPTFFTAADPTAGYSTQTSHTTLNNLDYDVNQVLYASTADLANTDTQYFMNAYALQLPMVSGYYEGTLYADNGDGWTSFAGVPTTGPNTLAGLRYTLTNAHPCGSASCDFGAGGTLGGTFNGTLEAFPDAAGLNPLYHAPWTYQGDVWENVFDGPLAQAPTPVNGTSALVDYMTSAHSVTGLQGAYVLGTGGGWYYFQEPCTTVTSSTPGYRAALGLCQGHSGPGQTPGPLQHGIGLPAANRTLYNGQIVSLTFKSGIYFFDGVGVYANDYLFTLNLLDVAGSPNLPDSGSPARGLLGGPAGLIAARMLNSHGSPCTVRCSTLLLYINSRSIWSLSDVAYPIPGFAAPVLPMHIWRYFNPDQVTSLTAPPLDTSRPYMMAAKPYLTRGAPLAPGTAGSMCTGWICHISNLEIGSGPFWFNYSSAATRTLEIDANPFYFNPNWPAMAATNGTTEIGSGMTGASPITGRRYCPQGKILEPCVEISLPLRMPLYNPTGQNMTCANGVMIPHYSSGLCQLMGTMKGVSWAATGPNRVKVYDASGKLWRSLPLSRNYTGYYYSFVMVGYSHVDGVECSQPSATCYTLPPGSYYATLQTTYFFYGQARVWYQKIGFSIP